MNDTAEIKLSVSPAASRAEVLERLRAHEADVRALHATALYLFGSAVRDELRPDSDVDVFFDYDPAVELTLIDILRLQRFLCGVLGRDVDAMTRDSVHPRLRSRIEASSQRVL